MQLRTFTTLAAIALSCGAAAAQSKPRVLVLDDVTGPSQGVLSLRPAQAQPGAPGIQEQGFLGVQLATEDEGGAAVSGLVDGSPAQKAGLQPGDRITAVDGNPIQTAGELTAAVRGKQPGAKVKLTVARGEQTLEQEVTLGTRGGLDTGAPQVVVPRILELAEPVGRLSDLGQVLQEVEGSAEGRGDAPQTWTRRIEVQGSEDGTQRMRVWVNGEEVHSGEVELEGPGGRAEGQTRNVFRVESQPGAELQVLRPGQGGASRQRGDLLFQPRAGALSPVTGLAQRVDALEERLGRIEQSLAELRALLGHGHEMHGHEMHGHEMHGHEMHGHEMHGHEMHGHEAHGHEAHGHEAHGHEAHGQPHATPQVRVETRVERRTEVEPRMRVERRNGRRAEAPAAPPAAEAPPVDELRREIRDLMRAIERLERGGGGR